MGDSLSWNNMDDRERQGLIDSVRKQADDSGTFVNISGDTMTGTLEVPGFVATGTASLSAVRVTNQILGSTMNLSGAATLTGPTQFTNELRSTTLVNSGNATITGSLNIATKAVIAANASGTNPLTVQHVSTVIGGPTIAPILVIASAASQAFIDFRGAVISTASLSLTGANIAGLVRVWFQGSAGNAAGWLPIFTDAIAK
jgi:hypothetical protein